MRRALLGAALALALVPSVAGADVTSAPVRHVRVGDVDLAYRSIGHGEPVVMIMGLGGTMDAWLPQLVGRIGGGRRIVVFDNRGTGRSSAGIKPITVRTMAGDTHGLIRRLKLEHPDVLGWSMGGFIAQRLDLDHPRDVDRLVLAATTGGGRGRRGRTPTLWRRSWAAARPRCSGCCSRSLPSRRRPTPTSRRSRAGRSSR
ncbi:MAG: alpha/beta fold hydrolase [Solirubrobacteraceae bacterium]